MMTASGGCPASTSVEIRNEFWTSEGGKADMIYISRNSKWVLDNRIVHIPNRIYISRNSKWVLDLFSVSLALSIYISRNSKWVLDLHPGPSSIPDLHQWNSKWVLDPPYRRIPYESTSVKFEMSFGPSISKDSIRIYISRNSKWVLDDQNHIILWLSTSVEIRNEFWTDHH